jgi:hypothetical protein
MKRPRITTGWLMVAVLLIASALGSGLPALDVYRDPDLHMHEWGDLEDGKQSLVRSGMVSPPFWPRYWRRLAGQPGNRQPICTSGGGHFVEVCERNLPKRIGECYVEGELLQMEAALRRLQVR